MSKARELFKAKPKGPVRSSQMVEKKQEEKSLPNQILESQLDLKPKLMESSEKRTQKQTEQTETNQSKASNELVEFKECQRAKSKQNETLRPAEDHGRQKMNQKVKIRRLEQMLLKTSGEKSQKELKVENCQKLCKHENQTQNGQSSHVGKHYKIFNPEHFKISDGQVKTSVNRWLYGTGETPNKLLISSWNVNGIRARLNSSDIQPYVHKVSPDIFCVNEHKMDERSYNEQPINFWGYHGYWNFSKYSLGYSGVAIFSKYPAIRMIEDVLIPEHSKEGRVITLEFQKFYIVQTYIPTVGRQLERLAYRTEEYDPAFREFIKHLQSQHPKKSVIVSGDMNVSHGELDCHTGRRMKLGQQASFTIGERNSFTKLLKQCDLVDTFRHFYPSKRAYTWWNQRIGGKKRAGDTGIGKRLDYFLVERGFIQSVDSSEIQKEWEGCDHCPIELRIDLARCAPDNAESPEIKEGAIELNNKEHGETFKN